MRKCHRLYLGAMYFYLAISLIYLIYCLSLWRYIRLWNQIPTNKLRSDIPVSVVIPFRNEASNLERLAKGLLKQKHQVFEVIFVDDHSDDGGAEVLFKALKGQPVNFRILELTDEEGKKAALTYGILEARYPLIVTSDADCFMDEHWLNAMVCPFENDKVKMVSGPVAFIKNNGFSKWQAIEFQALIAIGAAYIQKGEPNMANGANLAFRKEAFYEVGGYADTPSTPSGDDEFLLAKVGKKWSEGIFFNKSKEALVVTKAASDWSALKAQKIRWASKWKLGQRKSTKALAILIGIIQLAQIALLVSLSFSIDLWIWAVVLLVLRMSSEWTLIWKSSKDIGASPPHIGLFILSFIIYPFYAVYIALLANFGSFTWKGRVYNDR